MLLCVTPWAVFLLWTAFPKMLDSVAARESFNEGLTPGYFILHMALVVQCAITAGVFFAPWTVHQLDAPVPVVVNEAPLSPQELKQQMRDMSELKSD